MVTQGPIFEQDQIKRAVELGLGITSPLDFEFSTDSKESEKLGDQIKEKLAQ